VRIVGRILAFLGTVAAILVAVNHAQLVRLALTTPEYWDGGRGPEGVNMTLAVIGGGAIVMIVVALPAVVGVFAGPDSRRTAFWLLILPGIIGLVGAAVATGVWIALQPEGLKLALFVAGPLAVPPIVTLVAGLLMRPRRQPRYPAPTAGYGIAPAGLPTSAYPPQR